MAKSRNENLEDLEKILYNIKTVEKQLSEKIEQNPYYLFYGTTGDFDNRQEIRTKALAYWKRRFNRILSELIY